MTAIKFENILLILILVFVMYYLFKWYIYTEGFGKKMRKFRPPRPVSRAPAPKPRGFKSVAKAARKASRSKPKFRGSKAVIKAARKASRSKPKPRGFKAAIKQIKRQTTVPRLKPKSGGFKLGGFKGGFKLGGFKAAKQANNRAMMSTGYSMSNLGNTNYNYTDLSKPVIGNIKSGIDQSNKLISDISRDALSKTLGSFDTSKLTQMFPSNILSSIGSTFRSSNSDAVESEIAYNTQMERDKMRIFGPQKTTNKKVDTPMFDQNVISDQINNQLSRFNITTQ